MATVHDVVAYLLEKKHPMTAMKVQKLVYYCQAWSLVWDDRKLFPEKIEAWVNGPVVPELFEKHQGKFELSDWTLGCADNLDDTAKETIDAVLEYYGDKTAQWLVDLTHLESPWRDARKGLEPGERGDNEITPAAMQDFYMSITNV